MILDHNVEIGNSYDAAQLVPAVECFTRRTGRPPRAVTADRGYGIAAVEHELHQLGVRSVATPRTSNPGAAERDHRNPAESGADGQIGAGVARRVRDRRSQCRRGGVATCPGGGGAAAIAVTLRLIGAPATAPTGLTLVDTSAYAQIM